MLHYFLSFLFSVKNTFEEYIRGQKTTEHNIESYPSHQVIGIMSSNKFDALVISDDSESDDTNNGEDGKGKSSGMKNNFC